MRLLATVLAGQTTLAGELLLLAVVLGCRTWRCLLGAGVAPLTLFLCYGYVSIRECVSVLLRGFGCESGSLRGKMMPADLLGAFFDLIDPHQS